MISSKTTIKEFYRLGLMSARAMNVCHYGEIKTLAQLLETNEYRLRRIKNCGRKTLLELEKFKEDYKHYSVSLLKEETNENSDVKENKELEDAKKKIELLAPSALVQFKRWIRWRFDQLSVRAKNVFPDLCQLFPLLDTLFSKQKLNTLEAKNVGLKTNGEIQNFLSDVKAHFEEITQVIDPNVNTSEYNEFDRIVAQLEDLYPFLLAKECDAIATHMMTHDIFPILYIVKQYIFRSEDVRMDIYREYYGFNSDGMRYNLSEIGIRHNLSRERIRQLINKGISLPKGLKDKIAEYLSPLMENVIPFDSQLWNKIQSENMLEESSSQTARFVCSITDSHTIIQINNGDKEYLVNKNLQENVKIKNVLSNLVRTVGLRRATIEQIDILEYIREEKLVYHENVDELCQIYANFLKNNFEVEISNDRYVKLFPNSLDVSLAIEDILAQGGVPMSLDEIHQKFNMLHPGNAIDKVVKLKAYIFKNPNIKAKGKTGVYILKSWSNHYTGTLTSYLTHILETFEEPIPLDDLVDFALEQFPKSNKKSIYSLIIGDRENRFVIFENDYVGLVNNSISELDLKERRIIKRFNFDTRFGELKKFVLSYKRFPCQRGFEEETSLARWLSNILKSKIDATPEQVMLLNSFLSEHKGLPQNSTEYNFKQMCDEIKVMVSKCFALPSPLHNTREYNWLRKNREQYLTYKDNRKEYFEDLLSYLKDFGFYL